jgi:hypothetical protein
MNKHEHKMLNLLKRGKQEFGVVATKAEFEAEGTRVDELLRLLEIAHKADVPLTLKIGGCEAIRDLLEAKQFGVSYVVAPMVETSYALTKYIAAKNKVFSEYEQEHTDFLFNIETITGYNNRLDLVKTAAQQDGVDGVVFGRVDFVGSLGTGRGGIEDEVVTQSVCDVAALCKEYEIDFVVGGAISIDVVQTLRRIREVKLTRFETRKVVFTGDALELTDMKQSLLDAVHFELLWLINKQEYYGVIHREDDARIQMLESRWKILQNNA